MPERRILLAIPHHHSFAPPPPLEEIEDRPDRYVGYFCNAYGEQMIFVYEKGSETGLLYHGDCEWQASEVRNGEVPDLLMSPPEQLWLRACWTATEIHRS